MDICHEGGIQTRGNKEYKGIVKQATREGIWLEAATADQPGSVNGEGNGQTAFAAEGRLHTPE